MPVSFSFQIDYLSISVFLAPVLPLPLVAHLRFAPVVRDHPHTGSPKVRVGGHERDAAGAANGSEAQPPMVEREREHATVLRVEANGAA